MNPQILTIIVGVSGFIGLLSLLAYLFVQVATRKAEDSVRSIVEGEGLFNANQIVTILEQFQDDTARVEALKTIANIDLQKAESLLNKVKDNVDINKLSSAHQGTKLKNLRIVAVLFIVISLTGLIYSLLVESHTPKQSTPPENSTTINWNTIKNTYQTLSPGENVTPIHLSVSTSNSKVDATEIKYEISSSACSYLKLNGNIINGKVPYYLDDLENGCQIKFIAKSYHKDGTLLGETDDELLVTINTHTPIREISVGVKHACARKIDNSVLCWGTNGYLKEFEAPNNLRAKKIVAGFYNQCAITESDSIVCWGSNKEKGHGYEGQDDPPKGLKPKEIIAGSSMACSVELHRTECWGTKLHTDYWKGKKISGDNITTFSGSNICGLNNGSLLCDGRSGKHIIKRSNSSILQYTLAESHVCMLYSDSSIVCFHFDLGKTFDITHDFGKNVRQITSTEQFICALYLNGTVDCLDAYPYWDKEKVRNKNTILTGKRESKPPSGLVALKLFPGNYYAICAITNKWDVVCWNKGQEYGEKGETYGGPITNIPEYLF